MHPPACPGRSLPSPPPPLPALLCPVASSLIASALPPSHLLPRRHVRSQWTGAQGTRHGGGALQLVWLRRRECLAVVCPYVKGLARQWGRRRRRDALMRTCTSAGLLTPEGSNAMCEEPRRSWYQFGLRAPCTVSCAARAASAWNGEGSTGAGCAQRKWRRERIGFNKLNV
jgi:hypothetical protein